MIYEGANGIQALDLVGRKLAKDGGRAVMAFFNEVARFCQEHAGDEALKPLSSSRSQQALGHLQQATMWFMQNAMAKPDNAGAGADRLHAPLRPRRARLYVGADREGRAGEARRGATAMPSAWRRSCSTGALLHGAACCRRRRRLARITAGATALMALPGASMFWIPTSDPRLPRTADPDAGRPPMTEAFIYDHVRTPRGRGKPDGVAARGDGARARRHGAATRSASATISTRRWSTTSCSAASIRSARRAATSPARRCSRPASARRCRACRSTASAPRASTR